MRVVAETRRLACVCAVVALEKEVDEPSHICLVLVLERLADGRFALLRALRALRRLRAAVCEAKGEADEVAHVRRVPAF